jgi:hypothetical protein
MDTEVREKGGANRLLDELGGEIPADATLEVVWRDGHFLGRHWLLGEIRADLSTEGPTVSRGVLQALHAGAGPKRFFPATNENQLWFVFGLPRFRITLAHTEPVINRADINGIPPYEILYPLREPVTLRSVRWRWLKFRIASCVVKTMAEEGLRANVIDIRRRGNDAIVVVNVTNVSAADEIDVVWSVTATTDEFKSSNSGRAVVGRTPTRIEMELRGVAAGKCKVCSRIGILEPRMLSGAATAPAVASF